MNNLYSKIMGGIGMVTIADLLSRVKYFILIPVLAKKIGVLGFGLWTQVMATISILLPIALLGSDLGLVRFLPGRDKNALSDNISSILFTVCVSSALMGFLVIAFSIPIASIFFKSLEYANLIRLTGIYLFTWSLKELILKVFRIKGDFKIYSVYLSIESLSYVIVGLAVVFLTSSIFLILLSFTVINFIFLIIYIAKIKKEVGFRAPRLSCASKFILHAFPLVPIAWFLAINNMSDRYIIGFSQGISQVGIYSAAYSLSYFVINFMTAALLAVMQQVISELWNSGNFNIAKDLFNKCIKYTLYLTLPVILIFMLISRKLIISLTTEEFSPGASIVPFVLFGYLFFIIAAFIENILLLKNRTSALLLIYMLSAAINVSLNLFLVPKMGIMGAAIVTLITFLIHLALCIISVLNEKILVIEWSFLIKLLLVSVSVILLTHAINSAAFFTILLKMFIGLAVYFGFLFILGIPRKKEILMIKDIIAKKYLLKNSAIT